MSWYGEKMLPVESGMAVKGEEAVVGAVKWELDGPSPPPATRPLV